MSMIIPSQQPSYSQLVSQLKSKTKQIQFLQDKIVLMHKERQTKIAELSSKYTHALSQHNLTTTMVEDTNAQLKAKLTRAKQRIAQLNQTFYTLSQQTKHLTESNSTLTKQTKTLKGKYEREKHQTALLEQQSLNLKSIVNILQKQLRQVTKNNLELIQQKNILMTTYNDYDEVKFKLAQIHDVYQEQYEQEVKLLKDRMKQELERGAESVVKSQTQIRTQNHWGTGENQEERADILLTGIKTVKQKTCQKCLLEASSSEDIIKLNNLVSYGPEYLLSLQNHANNLNHTHFQFNDEEHLNNKEHPNSQEPSSKVHFNYPKTHQILAFITQLLIHNQSLKSQLQQQSTNTQNIKAQMELKISQLLEQLTSIQDHQHKTAHQAKQQLELFQNSINQIHNNKNNQIQTIQSMTHQIHLLKQHSHSHQLLINSLLTISAKIISKYHQLETKTHILLNTFHIQPPKPSPKNTLKKTLHAVFFVQILKKNAEKLKRKSKLHFPIKTYAKRQITQKNKNPNSQFLSNQIMQSPHSLDQSLQKDDPLKHISVSSLIFGGQSQSISSDFFSDKSSSRQNFLRKCVYEIRRESILDGKKKHNDNFLLPTFIKQLPQSNQSQTLSFVYRSAMQMIRQTIKGDLY